MPSDATVDCLVVDWNNFPVGKVREARRDARTHALRALVVDLSDAALRRAGERAQVEIPMQMVFGLRRREVQLDRSFEELVRVPAMPA
jgi:hypothetical protein